MSLVDVTVKPDFEAFARCIKRQGAPERVFNAELYLDGEIKLGVRDRFGLIPGVDRSDPLFDAKLDVAVAEFLGYDIVRLHTKTAEFNTHVRSSADSETGEFQRTSQGYVVHEHGGPIQNEYDLEHFPWPKIEDVDFSVFEWAEKNLPEGMKVYDLSNQFFECSTWLMGYETLFVNMYEDEDLIEEMLARISSFYLAYSNALCDFDCVGLIWGTDDMGYKTQTLCSPDWLRENILPLHKRGVRDAHAKGKMYFLHSCGKIDAVVDELINEVGIDAKHSFEDEATPVEEFARQWGDRVAVIGGIDMDFLARADEKEVRERTRRTLELLHPGGGYALGSGNSVANYIPLNNYLAMLEEGRRFGPG